MRRRGTKRGTVGRTTWTGDEPAGIVADAMSAPVLPSAQRAKTWNGPVSTSFQLSVQDAPTSPENRQNLDVLLGVALGDSETPAAAAAAAPVAGAPPSVLPQQQMPMPSANESLAQNNAQCAMSTSTPQLPTAGCSLGALSAIASAAPGGAQHLLAAASGNGHLRADFPGRSGGMADSSGSLASLPTLPSQPAAVADDSTQSGSLAARNEELMEEGEEYDDDEGDAWPADPASSGGGGKGGDEPNSEGGGGKAGMLHRPCSSARAEVEHELPLPPALPHRPRTTLGAMPCVLLARRRFSL